VHGMVVNLLGAGPSEWIWSAIAAGDVPVLRAAPSTFCAQSTHPRYGSVLTAFLQGVLNLEGRFATDHDRMKRARELIGELGRRGARPDMVIPNADFEVKSLYRDWRLTGDITAMQGVIQMRNDLINMKYSTEARSKDIDTSDEVEILCEIIDCFAELTARNCEVTSRIMVPDVVVTVWEKCLEDKSRNDVTILSPDGQTATHSLLLRSSSPVLAAMLGSQMEEGTNQQIKVEEPVAVVELFLRMLFTGCLPQETEPEICWEPSVNLRMVVQSAFMSNSAKKVLLPARTYGEIQSIDSAGDVLIKFDNIPIRQWVMKRNFKYLQTASFQKVARLHKDLAATIGLLHRWQVDGLADIVAERLESEITVESFDEVLQAALVYRLDKLKTALLAFAQNSPQVHAGYQAGRFGPLVQNSLQIVFNKASEPPLKRSRESL